MNIDRFSESKPVEAFTAGTALAAPTVTGLSIDTQNYRSLTLVLDLVISAGSVDSVSFEESDDNSVWVAVPDADALYYPDDFPLTADAVKHVGTVAKKRYVRAVLNCTGPTGSITASLGLLQDSLTKPQVKESSVIADADVNSPDQTADALSTPPKRT